MGEKKRFVETSFLIPLQEDKKYGDGNGKLHSHVKWRTFDRELRENFSGFMVAPGNYSGYDEDGTFDLSKKYIIAIEKKDLNRLKAFLHKALYMFKQKYIYFAIAGEVEFIRRK